MIVVGTAGHIDHGKSSIIRRLTGTNPDRLPEEQKRGLTIDLGFAFYETAAGLSVGFVDVPGHERFVKNMIAGAGGIDAVMLVIAADDGWMPQSEEHFQVVRLLGVKHGLIVINKSDLVEPDWLELLDAEIEEKVAGTFLEGAPRVPVSAHTGDGFDQLTSQLDKLVGGLTARRDLGKPRLYIDRSFVRPGIGGVVTGTLRGGSLNIGQNVTVWPSGASGKIRSLHCNNQDVHQGRPGQRTAIGFSGIDKEELDRGGVVTDRDDLDYFRDNCVLALTVELLPGAPVDLADRRRVLLMAGTTEMTGEVRVLDGGRIRQGETGIIFYKPDEPILAYVGDHVILRLPTPMVTLGGGRLLDHLPFLPRRREHQHFAYLKQRTGFGIDDLVRTEFARQIFRRQDKLLQAADVAASDVAPAVDRLVDEGTLGRLRHLVFAEAEVDRIGERLLKRVRDHFESQPHLRQLPLEQVARLTPIEVDLLEPLVDLLASRDRLVRTPDGIDLPDRGVSLTGGVKAAHDDIMKQLEDEPYAPPMIADLAARGKNYREAIGFLVDTSTCYKVGSAFLLLSETWESITTFIRETIEKSNQLSVGELRDKFGMTRKYIVPILEETDRVGITRREGDVRVKGEKF